MLITSALMLGVYTIVKPAAEDGWGSGQALALGAVSLVLLAAFLARETKARTPLVPLRIFRSRNVTGANLIQILSVAGMFGMFFLGALYLERVLHYSALEIGLAFLPVTVIMGTLSVRYTERLVMRFGARTCLFPGLLMIAAALVYFHARAGGRQLRDGRPAVDGAARRRRRDLLPGADDARDVGRHAERRRPGLRPGQHRAQAGGALGLAILATLSSSRSDHLLARRQLTGGGADRRLPRGLLDRGGVIVASIIVGLVVVEPPERAAEHVARTPTPDRLRRGGIARGRALLPVDVRLAALLVECDPAHADDRAAARDQVGQAGCCRTRRA